MKETLDLILENKLIMIVRGIPNEQLIDLAESMWRGGIRLMEITYDASGNIPDEQTAQGIADLAKHFEGRMTIGAGTVLKESQITLTKEAGGKFIISPDTNVQIIEQTKKQGLVSIPGALTPSEAGAASRAGADLVKLFPIGQMGPSYLKALCAPLSHIRFLAVGGVRSANMAEYLHSGASGFGIGLTAQERDEARDGVYDALVARCKEMTAILKQH